jgi:hypothetical protein
MGRPLSARGDIHAPPNLVCAIGSRRRGGVRCDAAPGHDVAGADGTQRSGRRPPRACGAAIARRDACLLSAQLRVAALLSGPADAMMCTADASHAREHIRRKSREALLHSARPPATAVLKREASCRGSLCSRARSQAGCSSSFPFS